MNRMAGRVSCPAFLSTNQVERAGREWVRGPGWGGWGPWGMESLSGTANSSAVNIGTLVVGSYDPTVKQLVWIGAASQTVDPGKNQEKNRKNLDKEAQKVLEDLPPRRK